MKKIVGICHIRGTMCQRPQRSAKADILFRMLLVKQHSKIGICFAPAMSVNLFRSGCIYNRTSLMYRNLCDIQKQSKIRFRIN